jgi:hypothetical protein
MVRWGPRFVFDSLSYYTLLFPHFHTIAPTFRFWTNLFMMVTATVVAVFGREFVPGVQFCTDNPVILRDIALFAACRFVRPTFQPRARKRARWLAARVRLKHFGF